MKRQTKKSTTLLGSTAEDSTQQPIALKMGDRQVNAVSNDLPEQRLKSRATGENRARVGKPALLLMNSWKLRVNNSES